MSDLAALARGCTFDDFLFTPQFSVVERRDPSVVDLSCRLSEHLALRNPLVSANMDTITRSAMAIVLAEEGGIGIIDRGFKDGNIAAQVREVEIVKRRQHGIIPDPYTILPGATLTEAVAMMERSGVGTLVVVDQERRLRGLLTERDTRFVAGGRGAWTVSDRMTPVEQLVVHRGMVSMDAAERIMVERKVKKLPLVDEDGVLVGLITSRDIVQQQRLPFASRDAHGRLRVGAAIGAKGDYLERAAELIRAGTDLIVIDIAHAHSSIMARAIEAFRARFGDVELIAGNVSTAEGAAFLAERGVNGIKVGIGPGGGCTTRVNTNFGVPQLQALAECRAAVSDRIPLVADGGIRRDGSLIEALLFGGDAVMAGTAFAGTLETPGDTIHKSVLLPDSQKSVTLPFKVFRGMASMEAMVDRLDVEDVEIVDAEALGAEGLEVSVPLRGSVRPIIARMLKHLCSSISYGGATSLAELKRLFREHPERYVIRVSEAARRESFER